jgi:hypothetical protein
MSLRPAQDAGGQGYQAVPLPRWPGDEPVLAARLTRQASPRPGKQAVLYVHCLADPDVQPDLAGWYLQRGFHFYLADTRAVGPRDATLADYFGWLDAATRQLREAEGNRVVLVSAHRAGAVIAALWCHARRASGPAEALIMADPDFGPSQQWLHRLLATGGPAAVLAARGAAGRTAEAARRPEVLPQAQRRLRRGLGISCPVLVLSPSVVNVAGPGARYRAGRPIRLGSHVTWLRLASAPPGLAKPDVAARRRLYEELSRWIGAYLSGSVRDQLL